jgi:hypothetical protein
MAPEYATRGCLTRKADIYSYGVVALEIVSGMSNTNSMSNEEYLHLLDWVLYLDILSFLFLIQGTILKINTIMFNSSYLAKLFRIIFHKATVEDALLLLIVGLMV